MSSQRSVVLPDDYDLFLSSLKTRIRTAQVKAALAVNRELILMYWHIGQDILQRQQNEGWGSKVITRLAKDLKQEFPDITGFSRTNLMYMRAFAEAYPDEVVVQQVVGQLPWGHNIALLEKLKEYDQRLWYAGKATENGWSRNVLILQIQSGLHQRTGEAITNFERTLPPEQSDLRNQLLKDPYNFDFLSLTASAQERDLERSLVEHIRDFLLELGVGFAFVGSQYRLEVEGDEYFIDLLFYHLKLHCYVVVDLKMSEFKPEFAGKMNFYVTAVNRLLKDNRDDPTIGIVLCRSKKRTIVEFALETVQNPIGVSTYKLREELPPSLKGRLPSAEELEMEMETAFNCIESRFEHQAHE
ncbi:MAG: PDDEXK nuclease domain-containing protein [Cyanobacteria bacterium P01_A01_bin.37]